MTLSAWPSTLPKPNRDAHKAQFQEARLGRTRETGPPGFRRRWSSVARTVGLAVDVDRAGKSVLDAFFETTLKHGSLPFTMPDPVTDGWPLLTDAGAPVLDESGAQVLMSATWTCLFAEPPVEALTRPLWFRISFSVWVMP